jgi:hypothetical protein
MALRQGRSGLLGIHVGEVLPCRHWVDALCLLNRTFHTRMPLRPSLPLYHFPQIALNSTLTISPPSFYSYSNFHTLMHMNFPQVVMLFLTNLLTKTKLLYIVSWNQISLFFVKKKTKQINLFYTLFKFGSHKTLDCCHTMIVLSTTQYILNVNTTLYKRGKQNLL